MRKSINVPPPEDFASFSPSELFKFYFQIGRWTEESFSDALQVFTRGKLVSTVTISKWKNKNVIPTRYSGAFLKLIESWTEPSLAENWAQAFETVWALHSAGRTQSKAQPGSTRFSDSICDRHRDWIAQLYLEACPGESFSPSDIYVPLQLSRLGSHDLGPQDVEDIIHLQSAADQEPDKTDWVSISGGPGAGKSMTALHLAQALCSEDIFPIFLRGSRLSNIDMDILDPAQPIADAFSATSFLKHFRASSFDVACLVLDGLDEIAQGSQRFSGRLAQFLEELKTEQTACAAHNKSLRIIILGREAHIQFAARQISQKNLVKFALRALDGKARPNSGCSDSLQGQDLRADWWHKYLAANGNLSDPSLPDFLTTEYDDFAEFGTDPLLTFLVCHAALEQNDDSALEKLPHERVNELTYAANKTEIYKTIIERQSQTVRHLLDAKGFWSVLQHIALAMWQAGGGQAVSLAAIYDGVEDPNVMTAFRALGLIDSPAQSPPDLLMTAFYYRLGSDALNPEETVIEFTHQTFAEYLISTILFDRFTRLISTFESGDGFEGALKDWVSVSINEAQEPSLADFCQKEAAIRFETLTGLHWDAALTIIRDHIRTAEVGRSGLGLLSETQNSANLLFFIWSCLNLERQKRTGEYFHLPNGGADFSVSDLRSIQRPNGLNFESGSRNEPILRDLTFLTPSLSALYLNAADMSQLSFSLGHIEALICDETSFAMTHWSHVKLSEGEFTQTKFLQVIFHYWRVIETSFRQCLFQGARFQGGSFSNCRYEDTFFSQCHFSDVEFISGQFKNVVFDRCVFSQSVFSQDEKPSLSKTVQFRHCTFMDMEASLTTLPAENFINSISETGVKKLLSPVSDPKFTSTLKDLL